MLQATHSNGITFAVDDVMPATEPLPECRAHEAVRRMLHGDIESCSDYHGSVVKDVFYQPLLAAVYKAFSQHRPLVLSPDAVWITIAQGVGHHMAIHGERLRSRFVAHQGRLELEFRVYDWVEGSPENPWPEAFAAWAGQIRDHVGHAMHDTLACDFSTSGALERAVSQIAMMDIFERYFAYQVVCVCGIPTVTMEGTPADWERLLGKVRAVRVFDIDWWLDHLEPICAQFVRASRGDVDVPHWRDICKLRRAYGGDIINGWVAKLFPYLRTYWRGPCTRRNPIFEMDEEGFQALSAPSGLSHVPFTWVNAVTGAQRPMEAIGGLVGVTQDPNTLALRPKLGWAVRQAGVMEAMIRRMNAAAAEHVLQPGLSAVDADRAERSYGQMWPEDMSLFYGASNGAELFASRSLAAVRFLRVSEIKAAEQGQGLPDGWFPIAVLADGSRLAMNRSPLPAPSVSDAVERRKRPGERTCAICHVEASRTGCPLGSPVVAISFTELLESLLKSGGQPYWKQPGFEPYGTVEQFTRPPKAGRQARSTS